MITFTASKGDSVDQNIQATVVTDVDSDSISNRMITYTASKADSVDHNMQGTVVTVVDNDSIRKQGYHLHSQWS